MYISATYSPEDNKIRLSASTRLDRELYERVRAAGYIWAPKQGIFVAPMWTPEREDLALELAGEIGDEDTSLVERAEERSERFEGYGENRKADADRAHAAVSAIADGIPLGQPILVGHHSERHARRDAAKIENGMRRAVKMWETSQYWEYRAAGAIRHAKYKELPAVRARRIKGIEADLRRVEKTRKEQEALLKLWTDAGDGITHETARMIANHFDHSSRCYPLSEFPRALPVSQYEGSMGIWSALGDTPELGIITAAQARERRMQRLSAYLEAPQRWSDHYKNRLLYERAMLAEGGGLTADKFDLAVGGRIKRRGDWMVITKLNRVGGALSSVSVIGHFASTVPVEEIQEYQPPQEGDAAKVAKVTALKPLCNWKAPGCIEMTAAEWKRSVRASDSYAVRHFTAEHGYVYMGASFDKGERPKPLYRQRSKYNMGGKYDVQAVFLTDAKVTEPPKIQAELVPAEPVSMRRPEDEADSIRHETERLQRANAAREAREAEQAASPFEAMREQLRTGNAVQVAVAPQLFPTPVELAERMVQEADIEDHHEILEPSAGTGNIMRACAGKARRGVAVELSNSLAGSLQAKFMSWKVIAGDFLAQNGNLGKFDRIIMNPPFALRADIDHIKHARQFLKPGGRLVAICANGPRQQEVLKPIAENSGGFYEPLPAGSFEASGTGVNAALLVIEGPSNG